MKRPLPDNFPKTATDWKRVIAAAPGEDRPLTPAEEAVMQRAVVVHSGGFAAVHEALVRRRRGFGKKPAKQQVTLRIEQDTLARWKASGQGWQTRIAQMLAEHAPPLTG